MIDTVIIGGKVVTDETVIEADVAIDDGQIVAVGDETTFAESVEQIDAANKLLLPGVVDPHVHFEGDNSVEPYKQGTAAAALGGVTTALIFAWQSRDSKPWTTLPEGIAYQREKAEDSLIDFGFHGVITSEKIDPAELDAALEEDVTSFKLFTAYEFGVSNGGLEHAFELIADRDAVALVHTEDPDVCDRRTAQQQANGKTDPAFYPDARPDHAEAMAADDALRLAKEASIKYYGVHTSGKESGDVIEAHRDDGSLIRAETCTHYTALNRSAYKRDGCLPIMAPPLRTDADRDELFEYLKRGTLEVVSTDHVAFTREQKTSDAWWDAGFGVNGLQRSLPVFHDEAVVRRGYSYPFLVRAMSTRPAQTFGLETKGQIAPGYDADIVVFDPTETQTVSAKNNASISDYTIYEGRELTGAVETTLVRGEVVAQDGEIVADPGHGAYATRRIPNWNA